MSQRICSVDGCEKRILARGWCQRHYGKWRRHGDPLYVPQREKSPHTRFWEKVEEQGECWVWVAGKDWDGYGIFSVGYSSPRAHRYAYEQLVGPVPAGLELDHLCRNRACVNPAHLDPVTSRVNTLRGESPPSVNAVRVECINGHPLSADRKCPTCAAHSTRRHRGWDEARIRSTPIAEPNAARAYCPQGHLYSPENTYVTKQGQRKCRTCHRDRQRAYYHAKKENPHEE